VGARGRGPRGGRTRTKKGRTAIHVFVAAVTQRCFSWDDRCSSLVCVALCGSHRLAHLSCLYIFSSSMIHVAHAQPAAQARTGGSGAATLINMAARGLARRLIDRGPYGPRSTCMPAARTYCVLSVICDVPGAAGMGHTGFASVESVSAPTPKPPATVRPTPTAPTAVPAPVPAPAPAPAPVGAASVPVAPAPVPAAPAPANPVTVVAAAPPVGEPLAAAAPPPPAPRPVARRRGGVSSVVGFLLGLSASTALGYYYLLGDHAQADRRLETDLARVSDAATQVLAYAQQIEGLKKQLAQLQAAAATKNDLDRVRTELLNAQVQRGGRRACRCHG
jgi:hypothetical protein